MSITQGLARAWGEPLGRAQVAGQPEDFFVDEQLSFSASEDGPHLLIQIEKRQLSTSEAIRRLAGGWDIPAQGIGHAGRKDREAVSRQWLTVPWPIQAPLPQTGAIFDDPTSGKQLRVLKLARHRRKLPVGALTGNRFRLRLREFKADPVAVNARLQQIATAGVPNYFGGQRFGHDGGNAQKVAAWFAGEYRPRHRTERSMLLSSARSICFNAVLSERVETGDWATPGVCDLVVLDGRGSLFAADTEAPARLAARAAGLRVHATGPLPGQPRKGLSLPEQLSHREDDWLRPHAALVEGLQAARVDAARRALRLAVGALAWRWADRQTLELQFSLPKGCYATAVLRELVDWEIAA